MHVEVAPGEDLEQGLPVQVDLVEVLVLLVVDVGIRKSMDIAKRGTLWIQSVL